jgi:GAF domain-containing protein
LTAAEVRGLAEEQAALRRVATLVARGVPAEELFEAVTEEVGRLLVAELATMVRYAPDGAFTIVGNVGSVRTHWRVGSRWLPGGNNTTTLVFETARPARIETFDDATGAHIDRAREAGIRSAVGTPIIVQGHLWGGLSVGSTSEVLALDTEARFSSFTELVATAIANAESRAELGRLADEQEALRLFRRQRGAYERRQACSCDGRRSHRPSAGRKAGRGGSR